MSNGIKFDADGNMIVAEGADYGGRRVTRTDMKTGKSYIIAGLFEGRPFNSPNDITIDEKGRIYFSDPRYLGHEPIDQPVQAVYRIDPDGTIHRIITDAGKPQRRRVSPDQKTLYVVSNDNGIDRHRPAARQGRPGAAAQGPHGPAGLRSVARRHGEVPQDAGRLRPGGRPRRPGLRHGRQPVRRRPRREPARHLRLFARGQGTGLHQDRESRPTSASAAATESKTLYITAGKSLYRIQTNKEGYQLPAKK